MKTYNIVTDCGGIYVTEQITGDLIEGYGAISFYNESGLIKAFGPGYWVSCTPAQEESQ